MSADRRTNPNAGARGRTHCGRRESARREERPTGLREEVGAAELLQGDEKRRQLWVLRVNYIGEYQNASPDNCVDDKNKPINFYPLRTCR